MPYFYVRGQDPLSALRPVIIPQAVAVYSDLPKYQKLGGNMPAYLQEGLVLYDGCQGHTAAVQELQRDLRVLGYLYLGIDGIFGSGTARAVRALQYDLLHNQGVCVGTFGQPVKAPVAMTDFNRDPDGGLLVTAVTGKCDQKLAKALCAMLDNADVGRIPESPDPAATNRQAQSCILAMSGQKVPPAFALAIAMQESGGNHFRDQADDHYLTIGLDHNDPDHPDHITSRGYGLGQYTLFYHPPAVAELEKISDPQHNLDMLSATLADKFEHFITGGTAATTADDRIAEHDRVPLRHCKFAADHPGYQKDCATCVKAIQKIDIRHGTPLYPGAKQNWHTTPYYSTADYTGVPDPAAFACDWPYAVRRYNGSGINSYHYQAHVLLHLLQENTPR